MTDRIASDHPSVETVRTSCVATATGHRLEIPADAVDLVPADDVVRLVVDGDERSARIEPALTGESRSITGVYESPSLARTPGEGTDLLEAWLDENGIDDGSSVLLDVVESDFYYGLRTPGESTVYAAKEPPSDSLASIAEDLED
ncbi:hypothetical protein Halru_0556 [Halovivax ruber XH-70]|uniref:Uncharacterized protein n=1 Tax=Halovivax ruber (strain DSM 18193 / JCM 13892 / XH-70) TaxID=797302 RepID=L0I901_HALRX|nr:hypothetical protein [Halovivax ruber]AGB15189.1 hypothetical protein Halru_0556 [Halovivax ruber XH-70]